MKKLLLTGGKQGRLDTRKPEWQRFEESRLGLLDLESGGLEIVLRHQALPENRPAKDPGLTFKSGSRDGDGLVVTDLTEVLVIDRELRVQRIISHPCFNDLHHVARIGGCLHVVSTGLDSLVVLDERGEVAEIRHALGEDPWQHFDRDIDYRQLATTKPHRSHPNFVFATESGLWVTRFEQQDAVCLDDPSRRIDIAVGNPHDGQQVGADTLWFTTTNGHLVEADSRTCEVRRRIDLNLLDGRDVPLGWCRGLYVEGDLAYVAFTKLRRTQWAKNLSWARRGFRSLNPVDALPTRVVEIDLERERQLREWKLIDGGLDVVFSVLPWE